MELKRRPQASEKVANIYKFKHLCILPYPTVIYLPILVYTTSSRHLLIETTYSDPYAHLAVHYPVLPYIFDPSLFIVKEIANVLNEYTLPCLYMPRAQGPRHTDTITEYPALYSTPYTAFLWASTLTSSI